MARSFLNHQTRNIETKIFLQPKLQSGNQYVCLCSYCCFEGPEDYHSDTRVRTGTLGKECIFSDLSGAARKVVRNTLNRCFSSSRRLSLITLCNTPMKQGLAPHCPESERKRVWKEEKPVCDLEQGQRQRGFCDQGPSTPAEFQTSCYVPTHTDSPEGGKGNSWDLQVLQSVSPELCARKKRPLHACSTILRRSLESSSRLFQKITKVQPEIYQLNRRENSSTPNAPVSRFHLVRTGCNYVMLSFSNVFQFRNFG